MLNETDIQPLYYPSINKENFDSYKIKYYNAFNEDPTHLSLLSYDLVGLVYYLSLNSNKENLNKMLDELDIPRGLNEIGVPEDSFKRIAKKSMLDQAYGQNPKKATLEEVEQLTLKSIKKAR